jgi:predicted nucleotidyltransferase
LDKSVESVLADTVEQARSIFGDALKAAVLFGSAAEDRLRERSDVNLILVLARFERAAAEQFSGPYRAAHAAIRLNIMFLLEGEISDVATAFAVKFLDIKGRHRVLYGADPFATLEIAPAAIAARLRQVLNNLRLRLRETYTLTHASDDRLRGLVAESASGLRAAAHALLALEGRPAESPRAAFEQVVTELKGADGAALDRAVHAIRRNEPEPGIELNDAVFNLIDLCDALLRRVEQAVPR